MRSLKELHFLYFGIIFLSIQRINGDDTRIITDNKLNAGDIIRIIENIDNNSPTSVSSETYDIYLSPHLDPAENFTFDGFVKIKFRILIPTDKIVLHYRKLTLQSITAINNQSNLNIIHQKYDEATEKYTIVFDTFLVAGSSYTINIKYYGKLTDNRTGFHKNSYRDTNGILRWSATTKSKDTRARDVFPCFDEQNQMAIIRLNILRKQSQISATNMALNTTKIMQDEQIVWDIYESHEPIAPDQVEIFIADSPTMTETKIQLLNKWNVVNSDNEIESMTQLMNEEMNDETYRLPITVLPNHYQINLHPHIIENDFKFDGIVQINATAIVDSNQIVLHINEIAYHEINLTVNGKAKEIIEDSTDEMYNFLTIVANETIKSGSHVDISIKYTGILNTAMRGFYRSSYTDNANNIKWLAATHLEPVGARNMFPCFDEPALKATFQISVIRSANYFAISNTELESTTNQGEYFVDTFKKTPIMSTYLVALVVSDFDKKTINAPYTTYARPNAISHTTYAASVMKPIVEYFEKVLGHAYQLPKLDMIALPDFISGAMENWGLITYRESNLLYDPEYSPITTKQSIISVIVHEISHQWFGNLVSPQWWNCTWLSEGFSRYFQYHATAKMEPDWDMENQFVIEQHHSSFEIDGVPSSHPMTYDVYSPAEVNGIFDQISYGKGGSILRMVEKAIGTNVFYAALHDYLGDRSYNYGTPEFLYTALQMQVEKNGNKDFNVKKFMDTWTTQAGFPVVDVNINGKNVILSQKRFLLKNSEGIDVYKLWWIPITYTTKSKPDFTNTTPKFWLSTRTYSTALSDVSINSDDWIIFNIQEAGYYRVNYDLESWKRIIMGLKSKDFSKIDQLNRAALMDDLFNLARAGHTDYFTTLNATQYLIQEINYIPWKAALNGLNYLNTQFTGKNIHKLFKIHFLTILAPIYNKLGFNEVVKESHHDKLLRQNIIKWACEFEVKDCIDKSLKLFANWRVNNTQLVPVNLRSTVYCTAIKYGTWDDYTFLWMKYLETDIPAEKSIIISALGCSRNTTQLQTLLMSAINTHNSPFRSQDIKSIFSYVYTAGIVGAQSAFNFIKEHYNEMQEYFGDHDEIAKIIGSISSYLTTKDSILQFQEFVESYSSDLSITAKTSLGSYVKRAREELAWYDKYSPRIFEWLDRTYPISDYRLPKSINPMTYEIFLMPHLDNNEFTFDGSVTIRMNVIEDISSIVLHANSLIINDIEVKNDTAYLDVSSYSINSTTDKLTIYLKTTVDAATILTISIQYTGVLNNNMMGFYRSYYTDNNGVVHWLATTQFEKFGARQAFPCFDEPSFKAKFTVNIERPNHYHSLSNMPLKFNFLSDKINHTWDSYVESEHMSSYLVAFIISDFDFISNSKGDFKIWSRPNAIASANYALDIGQKALDFLENYTGIDYPIDKIDLVAIPDFAAGAMENWGLVTFREYGLLTAQNITSATYMRYMATTVAHELVHMWFGNLVTCDWWEYIWLNEGFAEYLEYLVIDSIIPEWKMEQHFISYDLQVALLKDSFPYMRPMNNKMENPFDEGKDFTSVGYQKSASVIHMMRHAFGKDVFKKALHKYLDENKYKTGIPEYLWLALQYEVDKNSHLNGTNETVATLMDSWASQPGYPVVHANKSGNNLILTQERFLVTGKNETSIDQLYWIPITIASKTNPNFNDSSIILWLGKSEETISQLQLKDEWFILNIQQSGYYRVNYEIENWNKLIQALNEKNFGGIPEINRAQIIDDILNLARAEYISYDLALTASKYLINELHHLPWKAFFSAYTYLYERFDGHETSEILQKYVLNLSENVYKQLGFHQAPNDSQLTKTNRQLILSWVCKLNYNDCVQTSKTLFAQWRTNTSNTLFSPDAKLAVICTALRHGDYDDWNFAWKQYHVSNFESDKVVILNALGCTLNTTAINKYLNVMFSRDGSIRDQNVAMAFTSVHSAGKFGINASMEFLIKNYKEVYKYYGNWESVANLFSSVATKFSINSEIDRLKRFIDEISGDLKELADSLKATVSEVKANLEFSTKHGNSINNLLRPAPTSPPNTGGNGNSLHKINPFISIVISILTVLIVNIS